MEVLFPVITYTLRKKTVGTGAGHSRIDHNHSNMIHLNPSNPRLHSSFSKCDVYEAIWKKNTPFLLPKSLPRLRHLIWLHHWNKVDELMLSSNLERIEFTVWRRLMFCLRFKLLPREKKLVILRTQVWAFNDLGLKFQDWFFHHLFCRISFHLTSFTAAVPCQETAPSTSSPAQWTT